LLAAEGAASAIDARLWECAWVTGSVAVGTQRDGQDATGRESIIEPYLTQPSDFTREFANSTKPPIRFQDRE
jgi:hypothetical protein